MTEKPPTYEGLLSPENRALIAKQLGGPYVLKTLDERGCFALSADGLNVLLNSARREALLSRPIAGNEGEAVAWRTRHTDEDGSPWAYFDNPEKVAFYGALGRYEFQPLFAQPAGLVPAGREEVSVARGASDREGPTASRPDRPHSAGGEG